jgi:predicted protein tyrosine phosphatase
MRNILFLCARNRLRSPTAEQIFCSRKDLEVLSAGLNSDADNQVTGDMISEADIIFVMEKAHRRKLQQKFGKYLQKTRIICLDIPDNYKFMQPELITLLNIKVAPHLR